MISVYYSSDSTHPIPELSRELSPVAEKSKQNSEGTNLLPGLRMAGSPIFPVAKHRSRAVIKSFSASGLSLMIPPGRLFLLHFSLLHYKYFLEINSQGNTCLF